MIRGFGVSGQDRELTRQPLSGTKDGYAWRIECEMRGLFRWTAGGLSGFTARGVTLESALREIQAAIDLQADLVKRGIRVNPETLETIQTLKRWERFCAQGKLRVTMKRRTGTREGGVYYTVEELTD